MERVKGLFQHKEQRLLAKAADAEAAATAAGGEASSAQERCKELEARLAAALADREVCRCVPRMLLLLSVISRLTSPC